MGNIVKRAFLVSVTTVMFWAALVPSSESQDVQNERERLRSQLDTSKLLLEPRGVDLKGKHDATLNTEAFIQNIMQTESSNTDKLSIESNGGFTTANKGFKSILINSNRMTFTVRDSRAYDVLYTTNILDEDFASDAEILMAELGISKDDMDVEVAGLGVTEKENIDQTDQTTKNSSRRIATKVFINRSIGGIPVLGNYVVVSYALDGTLRKVLGCWHAFDYSLGRTSSKLSLSNVKEKALDELMRRQSNGNVRPVEDRPIELSTQYVIREVNPGVYTIDLQGVITYYLDGPYGQRKPSEHVFDI